MSFMLISKPYNCTRIQLLPFAEIAQIIDYLHYFLHALQNRKPNIALKRSLGSELFV